MGHTFQYIKAEHINEAELLLDTFISKYNHPSEVAKAFGYKVNKPFINSIIINQIKGTVSTKY